MIKEEQKSEVSLLMSQIKFPWIHFMFFRSAFETWKKNSTVEKEQKRNKIIGDRFFAKAILFKVSERSKQSCSIRAFSRSISHSLRQSATCGQFVSHIVRRSVSSSLDSEKSYQSSTGASATILVKDKDVYLRYLVPFQCFSSWREFAAQRAVRKWQQWERVREIQQKLDKGLCTLLFFPFFSYIKKHCTPNLGCWASVAFFLFLLPLQLLKARKNLR